MIRPMIALSLAIAPLSGCATVFTPERCEQALRAAQTAEQLIAALVVRGMPQETAEQWAKAIIVGRELAEAACAAARR